MYLGHQLKKNVHEHELPRLAEAIDWAAPAHSSAGNSCLG